MMSEVGLHLAVACTLLRYAIFDIYSGTILTLLSFGASDCHTSEGPLGLG